MNQSQTRSEEQNGDDDDDSPAITENEASTVEAYEANILFFLFLPRRRYNPFRNAVSLGRATALPFQNGRATSAVCLRHVNVANLGDITDMRLLRIPTATANNLRRGVQLGLKLRFHRRIESNRREWIKKKRTWIGERETLMGGNWDLGVVGLMKWVGTRNWKMDSVHM